MCATAFSNHNRSTTRNAASHSRQVALIKVRKNDEYKRIHANN